MKIVVKGTNISVTPNMQSFGERQLSKLKRFHPSIQEVTLTYKVQRVWYIAEVTLSFNNSLLRTEERSTDLNEAVSLAVGKMEKQVKRAKGRIIDRKRSATARQSARGEAAQGSESVEISPEAATDDGGVARVKRFAIKPMTLDEAIHQMELVSHDFFVFLQEDGATVSVLYRRKDGGLGLIVPEVG